MAVVKGAFFSTWASGSVGKAITVRACFNDNLFVMSCYKRSAGKRHQIQIDNENVFKTRSKIVADARRNI